MFFIKVPLKLKINIYKYKDFYIIKFLNKFGSIKKKISSKNLKITKFGGSLALEVVHTTKKINIIKLNKLQNILNINKLIMEQTIFNMFKIFKDRFMLEGIGFKVWKKKNCLKFKLGFSVPIFVRIPNGIKISIYKQKRFSISSLNLHCMRIFAQKLKTLKPIDVYKRKGVRL